MNPIHMEFIKNPPFCNYDQLFQVMDNLDSKKRDSASMLAFMAFVKLETDPDASEDTPFRDSLTDYTNYARFKSECRKLPASLSQQFVVNGVVFVTLSYIYRRAEMDKEACITAQQEIIRRAKHLMRETDEFHRERCQRGIKECEDTIRNVDQTIQEAKDLYAYICQNLARPLLEAWRQRQSDLSGL